MNFFSNIGVIGGLLIASPIITYVLAYAASEAFHASKLRYNKRFMKELSTFGPPSNIKGV